MVSRKLLSRFEIFAGLTDDELEKIATLCQEENYEVGAAIFKEGDKAKEIYIVVEGRVALEIGLELWPGASPRQTTVEFVTRGEAFGWSALVEPHILTRSARCVEKAKVLAIDGAALRRLLEGDPQLGYKVMATLTGLIASRLRDTRSKLTEFLKGEEFAHEYTPEEATLLQRVHYIINFRWIAAIGIVAVALFANRLLHIGVPLMPVYLIAVGIGFFNLLFLLRAKRLVREDSVGCTSSIIPKARRLIQMQSFLDLAALTVLLHFTGGIENPFIFYFIFHIIIASVLLPYRSAYSLTTLAVLLISLLTGLEYFGVIPHVHLERFIPFELYDRGPVVLGVLFALASTLYVSTYIATSIAGELRKRQREVAALKDRSLKDIKELEEANRRLVELDRLRTHFLAIASHDLKAPLAAVQSYLEVILGGFTGEISERQRKMLSRSSVRIKELLSLINDLLDATRIEAGQIVQEMERTSLPQVVESALENVRSSAAEKEIKLRVVMPEALPEIKASAQRLRQVLTNLLNNAVQFTPEGGEVALTVKDQGGHIQVAVRDTGIGIPADDLPRVFEEFYRSKKVETKGAGLGLAIAKKIVEAHGGKIWAESPPPESEVGSKFTFTLSKEGL